VSDISERKRVEQERLRFDQELRQAQKAESLARMAGAIADHFNNQLAVVMGNLELSMGEASGGCETPDQRPARRPQSGGGEWTAADITSDRAPATMRRPRPLRDLPSRPAPAPGRHAKRRDPADRSPVPGPAVNGNENQLQLVVTNLMTNAGRPSVTFRVLCS